VRSTSGKAIAPAVPFLEKVRAAGGRVFIVTSRSEEHCPFTETNLRRIQIPFDALLCKPQGDPDKNARFRAIEEGRAPSPFGATRVVLYVGDNILDFPNLDQSAAGEETKLAEFGQRFVVLPNPMYGSWEKNARE
jgi:5'-nucleotidase (lipoprotein e(P4) family)